MEDPTLILKKYGQFLYDHVVLLAPSTEEFSGGKVSTDTLVEFIDAGGNVLVTADVETGDAIRELASEVGVEIDESGNTVIDHFNFDTQVRLQLSINTNKKMKKRNFCRGDVKIYF